MCLGQIGEAYVAKARLATAYQDRRAVEHQPVNQPGAQEGTGCLCATFDDQAVAIERGDILRRTEGFPACGRVTAA